MRDQAAPGSWFLCNLRPAGPWLRRVGVDAGGEICDRLLVNPARDGSQVGFLKEKTLAGLPRTTHCIGRRGGRTRAVERSEVGSRSAGIGEGLGRTSRSPGEAPEKAARSQESDITGLIGSIGSPRERGSIFVRTTERPSVSLRAGGSRRPVELAEAPVGASAPNLNPVSFEDSCPVAPAFVTPAI